MSSAGQTSINPCWWCGEPAEHKVLVTPARYRMVKGAKELAEREVQAWACGTHSHARQAPPLHKALQTKATDVEQLGLLG